jgi:LacI family transcriptional regulator
VNAELKARVVAAIRELDYTPSLAARQLSSKKSRLLCMIVYGYSESSYFSRVVSAAANECRRHGYHLITETFDPRETAEQIIHRISSNLRPDGIILLPPLANDVHMVSAIEGKGTPLARLAVSEGLYGAAIGAPEHNISTRLVSHLVDRGHRRIGFVAPRQQNKRATERTAGYREALNDGLGCPLQFQGAAPTLTTNSRSTAAIAGRS